MTKKLTHLNVGNLRMLYYQRRANTAHVRIKTTVGSSCEAIPDEYGTAHFLEHMIFKGTKANPKNKLIVTLGSMGASNAHTSYDETSYYITTLPRRSEEAMDILLDMLTGANLDKNEMEKERNVILEEQQMYEDDSSSFFYNRFLQSCYGHSAHPIIGTRDSIGKITRKGIANFISRNYTPSTTSILASGPMPVSQVEAMAKQLGAKYKSRLPSGKPSGNLTNGPSLVLDKSRAEYEHASKQSIVALAYQGMTLRESMQANMADVVMMRCIGGSFGGTMFHKIRDELGLCYSIGIWPWRLYNNSLTVVSSQMDKKSIERCIEEVGKIIADTKKNGVSKESMDFAKQSLKFGQAAMAESPDGVVSGILDEYDYLGHIVDTPTRMKMVDSVRNEDIIACANRLFTEAPKVGILNP